MAYGYATDNFLRYPLLAQGGNRRNFHNRGGNQAGYSFQDLLNSGKQGATNFWNFLWSADDMELGPDGRVKPTTEIIPTWGTKAVFQTQDDLINNLKRTGIISGSGKDAATDAAAKGPDMGGFHDYWKMTPKEWLEMQGAEARKGVDHMLGSQLKYNLITKQIPQIGRQIGLGGAPFEYQGALADARNSTAVTMASKINPGPRTYLQPYRSYFS